MLKKILIPMLPPALITDFTTMLFCNVKTKLIRIAVLGAVMSCLSSASGETLVRVVPWEPDAGALEFSTLDRALREVREWRRLNDDRVEGGVAIEVAGGEYFLEEPILIRPEDSGTAESPTTIRAMEGQQPVFSGATRVMGWRKAEDLSGFPAVSRGNLWVSEAPEVGGWPLRIRDLWIGDRRAVRVRDAKGTDYRRILDWDREKREGWIEWPEGILEGDVERMEMVVHQMWAIAILRVKSMERVGERARVTFLEPESRVQFEHPWPPVVISDDGNSAYYLANHPAFLDEPGEWYQSSPDGRIYYWPRDDENMEELSVYAPRHEVLVVIDGSVDSPVQHIAIEGLQFSHTSWMRPSHAGHVPLQAGMYLLDAYKLKVPGTPDKAGLENQAWIGRKPAAVQVRHSQHIRFSGCRFEHLASSGLDFLEGGLGDTVEGNVFRDIGGNGIVAGAFQEGGIETHLPYDPADERILCRNLTIKNNLISDVANTDWGCTGIIVGFVRGVRIANNEVNNVSYTGISMGWGWTKSVNTMRNNTIIGNHIHHFGKQMYDTGGIYTLSPQPKSLIAENYIHSIYRPDFVHDPNHWSYIYLDEGSSYIIVRDNWTEGIKYSTNANGPGNTWENNGPDVDHGIMGSAGLEAPFRGLLKYSTVAPDAPVD